MDIAIIDEEMLPMAEISKVYMDRGTFFGDGVYEVIRSYNGKIFALPEHLKRFAYSLKEIKIDNVDIEQVKEKIISSVEKSGYSNAKIYFHITRGSEIRDHLPGKDLKPNFFLTVSELHNDPALKQKGIAVSTHPDWRWKRCDIKSLNLLANVLAKMEAKKKGASEAILVGDDGTITEGAGSAFFAIDAKEHALITRPLGHEILPSITRAMVFKIAQNAGLSIVEKSLTPQQAAACDELFIAVTTKDIVPVTVFDGKQISDGQCGELTKKLIDGFKEYVLKI